MRCSLVAVAAALALISTSTRADAFVPKSGTPFHRQTTTTTATTTSLSATTASSRKNAAGTVIDVPTKPIEGMKPGTSGLRKKVEVWQAVDASNEHYVENFIQSLLDTATAKNDNHLPKT